MKYVNTWDIIFKVRLCQKYTAHSTGREDRDLLIKLTFCERLERWSASGGSEEMALVAGGG